MNNKVPKGYKQTEVGVIPAEWAIKKLGEMSELITKGTTPTSLGKFFTKSGINFIKIESLEENGKIIRDKVAFIDEDTHLLLRRSQLRENDILFSIAGALGRVAIVGKDILPANTNQALAIVRLKKETITSKNYLFYFLNSSFIKNHISLINVQAAQANLSLENIRNLTIHYPLLTEQSAIAEALSDTDALIGKLEELITKKRQTKQGAMQELLTGKKRLPGFSGKWEEKTLGEIGECLIGLTYKPENVKESGLLVLRSSNIKDGVLKFENNVYVDVEVPEKLIVKEGDILICVRNGSRDLIGKCALIDKKTAGKTFGAFMALYRSPINHFIFHQFNSFLIKKQIDENIGATINQITNKNLNSFKVPLPENTAEQTAIATVLSDMDAEIEKLENKLEKYKMVKKGMMQELLTGKTRLI